jgi:4'-phosphopantetheinyl transferase EntD
MLRSLLPEDIVVVEAVDDDYAAALHPLEETCARGMGRARLREFRAGRACARRALASFGYRGSPLLRSRSGSPAWPTGLVGSLTHTRGFCAAAVASSAAYLGLGIDAEVQGRFQEDISDVICTEQESTLYRCLDDGERKRRLRAMFSAKESVLKAVFPFAGYCISPKRTPIHFDRAQAAFRSRVVEDRPVRGQRLPEIEGRVAFDEQYVYAVAILRVPASRRN